MRFQLYKDTAGEWRWRLKAGNNETIASGEGYVNRQDCVHAINLIKEAPIYIAHPPSKKWVRYPA